MKYFTLTLLIICIGSLWLAPLGSDVTVLSKVIGTALLVVVGGAILKSLGMFKRKK